ncbi:MAG TPA: phytanoyl-CoA dioxygenase family protein [Blastocatellia bacterium]|nr:phytanoyl-CoA dioxygenase family protein [Blastocatellia bacterium]
MAQQAERSGIGGTYKVTDAQVEEIQQRGCLELRGVLSPAEIAAYRPALCDYVMDCRRNMNEMERAVGASSTETIFSIAKAPPAVVEFVTSPRLGEIAARALGVEAVRLLHFSGFFKPGGGLPTPWHQDLTYMPLDTDKVVSIWVPLTDLTPEMGGLRFAAGSHLHGELQPHRDQPRFPLVQHGTMRAGDVLLHMGWTIHSSLENSSTKMREVITIGYYADGARIQVRGSAPIIRSFINTYFAGRQAGDLAEGPLNPVVFRRTS